MDELEIDGKKYISSRKAAKDHKYHADYIGQLLRAGKVEGKKVGRAWYVEATSLKDYFLTERDAARAPKEVTRSQNVEPILGAEVIDEPEEEEKIETLQVVEEVAPKVIPTIIPEPKEEKVEQRIHITLAEKEIPKKKSTLTYIEDNEPLIPRLEGRERMNADFTPAVSFRRQVEEEEVELSRIEETEEEEIEIQREKNTSLFRPRIISVLAAVALIALVAVTTTSAALATSIKVKEGQPATVVMTIK